MGGYKITLDDAMKKFVGKENDQLLVKGGRICANKQLSSAIRNLKDYNETRDTMHIETSMLSAYIKFGCVSIREVYWAFVKRYGKFHGLVRQLIWRDFYAHILYFYPENLGHLYSKQFSGFKWSKSKINLEAWKQGKTGVPLIDAGMRQLNTTGYMHNRVRMLTATYLVKILRIDWREGEKYFAQQLVDYDVASNSGNWQAIVGGGIYSMPWFRVMSPWAQSNEYDKECIYIKMWIEELKSVEPKYIHKWYKYCYEPEFSEIYCCPIVEYKRERKNYMDMMK
jgi:deoxyribodipyrimidine photo-lyase